VEVNYSESFQIRNKIYSLVHSLKVPKQDLNIKFLIIIEKIVIELIRYKYSEKEYSINLPSFQDLERMHVENVRSVIEELEREYSILSDKLNEHEKQTDGKYFLL
jgi:hypothetical protein